MFKKFFTVAAISLITMGTPSDAQAPVKLSNNGICHAPGSTYYARTRNFRPFSTMQECLRFGRLPRR